MTKRTDGNTIDVSGELTENTVWDGIVNIIECVIVPEHLTLALMPGTVVTIRGAFNPALQVSGTLTAKGKPGSKIYFDLAKGSGGILLNGPARGEFTHGVLTFGDTAVCCAGRSRTSLRYCSFSEQAHVGVLAEDNAQVHIVDSRLYNSSTAVTVHGKAHVHMKGCHVRGSRECGVNGLMSGNLSLERSLFEDNGTGISISAGARADVRGCRLHGNQGGVFADGLSRINLWENSFHANKGQDITLQDKAEIHCRRNREACRTL